MGIFATQRSSSLGCCMTPRFIVDANLPPALARMIAAAAYEATHVSDIDMLATNDTLIEIRKNYR